MILAAAEGAWYAAYRAGRAGWSLNQQVCEICPAVKPLGTKKLGIETDGVKLLADSPDQFMDMTRW